MAAVGQEDAKNCSRSWDLPFHICAHHRKSRIPLQPLTRNAEKLLGPPRLRSFFIILCAFIPLHTSWSHRSKACLQLANLASYISTAVQFSFLLSPIGSFGQSNLTCKYKRQPSWISGVHFPGLHWTTCPRSIHILINIEVSIPYTGPNFEHPLLESHNEVLTYPSHSLLEKLRLKLFSLLPISFRFWGYPQNLSPHAIEKKKLVNDACCIHLCTPSHFSMAIYGSFAPLPHGLDCDCISKGQWPLAFPQGPNNVDKT